MKRCAVCGSAELHYVEELSPALIREWELSAEEAAYVNRQQGLQCVRCGSTLRCMALATALLRHCGGAGTFAEFSASPTARQLRVLEINEAGGVAPFLAKWPGHQLVRYPDVDMQHLPHADGAFDLVVHSDTLEHVPDPVAGLAECRRVLRDSGALRIHGADHRRPAHPQPRGPATQLPWRSGKGRWLPRAHRVRRRRMAVAAGRRVRRFAFTFVRDSIRFEAYPGVLRGADGTLAARAGNSEDRALLLGALLDAMDVRYQFAIGDLDPASAQRVAARTFDAPTAPLDATDGYPGRPVRYIGHRPSRAARRRAAAAGARCPPGPGDRRADA